MMNDLEQSLPWIRIAKRALPYAIIFVFLLLFQAYARPISALLSAKSDARKTPELWNIPQPLQLQSNLPTTGRMLCYFGYQFNSPWTDVIAERKLKKALR